MENRIDFVQIKDFRYKETPEELIVPGVIAKEMVYHYPELKSKEFKSVKALEKAASLFKWAPVVVDHTQWPEIQVSEYNKIIGGVFVTGVQNGKLKGEYHFKKDKAPKKLLISIRAGKPLGTSAAFVCNKGPGGSYNGEDYDISQEDIMLKHVGVTLNLNPRCAIEQGCGVGLDAMTAINAGDSSPTEAFRQSKHTGTKSQKSPSIKQKPKSDSAMPFGEYESFEDCVSKNQDKENPEGYCKEIEESMKGTSEAKEKDAKTEEDPDKVDKQIDKVARLEAQVKKAQEVLIKDILDATDLYEEDELKAIECLDALRLIKKAVTQKPGKKVFGLPSGSGADAKPAKKRDFNRFYKYPELIVKEPERYGEVKVKKDG